LYASGLTGKKATVKLYNPLGMLLYSQPHDLIKGELILTLNHVAGYLSSAFIIQVIDERELFSKKYVRVTH
jgi:hypothetical protein